MIALVHLPAPVWHLPAGPVVVPGRDWLKRGTGWQFKPAYVRFAQREWLLDGHRRGNERVQLAPWISARDQQC